MNDERRTSDVHPTSQSFQKVPKEMKTCVGCRKPRHTEPLEFCGGCRSDLMDFKPRDHHAEHEAARLKFYESLRTGEASPECSGCIESRGYIAGMRIAIAAAKEELDELRELKRRSEAAQSCTRSHVDDDLREEWERQYEAEVDRLKAELAEATQKMLDAANIVPAPRSAEASPKHPIDRLIAAAGATLQWAIAQAPYQRDCRSRFPWYQELQEAQAGELFRSISDEEWAQRRERDQHAPVPNTGDAFRAPVGGDTRGTGVGPVASDEGGGAADGLRRDPHDGVRGPGLSGHEAVTPNAGLARCRLHPPENPSPFCKVCSPNTSAASLSSCPVHLGTLDVERWRQWLWVRLDAVTTQDHIAEIAEELAVEVALFTRKDSEGT